MNKAQGKFRQRVFAGALVVPSAAWILLSAVGVGKKLDYDTGEKRVKHEISEDAGLGSITRELDAWISDRVPFRSVLLSLNSGIDRVLELPYKKIIEPALLGKAGAAYETADSAAGDRSIADQAESISSNEHEFGQAEDQTGGQSADPTTTVTPIPANGYVQEAPDSGYLPLKILGTGKEKALQGRNGWLFYANVLDSYQGLDLLTEPEMEKYLKQLNDLHTICQARGMQQIYIYYPNKETVYSEFMPNDCTKAEVSRMQMIEQYANSHYPDLPLDYIYEEIVDAKPTNLLYQKQDTHWTTPGAVVGINNMYRMLGLPELDPDALNYRTVEGSYGDLFYLANASKDEYEPESVTVCDYKEEMAATVISSTNEANTIQNYASAHPDGKMLVIIGDSFTNAMVPILTCDFTRFYYVCWENIDEADWSIINQADYLVVEAVERNVENIEYPVASLIQHLG